MRWWFGGSVDIEQFCWRILEKQTIFTVSTCAWFRKPRWGVAYVPCVTNLRAIYPWVIRWHVTGILSLAEHWHGRRALSNNVCAHSVISMWHVIFQQHLARACGEQSRSTSVLPINHVIQIPQCLSGFVNHDYRVVLWEVYCPCVLVAAPHSTFLYGCFVALFGHCARWDCRRGASCCAF